MATSNINFQGLAEALNTIREYPKLLAEIPTDTADFEEKFGSFTDVDSITAFLEECKNTFTLGAKIGGPQELKAKIANNPSYLNAGTMPIDTIYDSIVWEANQIQNVSDSIVFTYNSLSITLDTTAGTKAQQAANLRVALIGDNGLSHAASKITADLNTIADKVDGLIEEAQNVVNSLTSTQSSDMVNKANVNIGILNSQISRLQTDVEELEGNSSWFGNSNRKEQIADKEAQIAAKQELLDKNKAFIAILNTHFFVYSDNKVVSAFQSLSSGLHKAVAVFQGAIDQWNGICGPDGFASETQLSDLTWINKALEIPDSTASWKQTASASQQFNSQSLIS